MEHPIQPPAETKALFDSITLSDLQIISNLGVGSYGRVDLVQIKNFPNCSFALKKVKKSSANTKSRRNRILQEKAILAGIECDFVVKLFRTFKDCKYLYMMMESCLGGDLWMALYKYRCFNDCTSKFYTACIVEALHYLHSHNIIFRDLKPGNVLVDNIGYVKLADFGFAKKLPSGTRTSTFCGTPEYMAPELVLNQKYDCKVDLWSLGALLFEFLTGRALFDGVDNHQTFVLVVQGVRAVHFPPHVSDSAELLIRELCHPNPLQRLDHQQIRKHRWFEGFDFHALGTRRLVPPIIPIIWHSADTSNFMKCFPDTDGVPADDLSDWDCDF